MSERLRDVIRRRFAGARLQSERGRVDAEIPLGDAWYRARVDCGAGTREARVTIPIATTDGFVLSVQWTDRFASGERGDQLVLERAPSFDDSALVETNDLALAAAWLDGEAREAILNARFVSMPSRGTTHRMLRDSGWVFEVAHDEVTAWHRSGPSTPQRASDVLGAVLALASRPTRWARSYDAAGRVLGGEVATRIELGGKPALRIKRGIIEIRVDLRRRFGPGDRGRIRTVVTAHRTADDALSWDLRAQQLHDLASPSSTSLRDHDVEIVFEGVLADIGRLGAAVELAERWSTDARPQRGPYR